MAGTRQEGRTPLLAGERGSRAVTCQLERDSPRVVWASIKGVLTGYWRGIDGGVNINVNIHIDILISIFNIDIHIWYHYYYWYLTLLFNITLLNCNYMRVQKKKVHCPSCPFPKFQNPQNSKIARIPKFQNPQNPRPAGLQACRPAGLQYLILAFDFNIWY